MKPSLKNNLYRKQRKNLYAVIYLSLHVAILFPNKC